MTQYRLIASEPLPLTLAARGAFSPVGATGYATLVEDGDDKAVFAQLLAGVDNTVSFGVCPLSFKPRAIFFDMDATLIEEESLVELARVVGKEHEVAVITERAMAGALDFSAALRERVALLKGLPATILDEVAARLTLTPGVREFAHFARELGLPLYLLSGGFTPLAKAVCEPLGFRAWRANNLEVVEGRLTGRLAGPIIDAEGKRQGLIELCAQAGVDPRSAVAIGDGANDVPMALAAGLAVGFRPKPVLQTHVQAVNRAGDHRFLGPLLFGRDLLDKRQGPSTNW